MRLGSIEKFVIWRTHTHHDDLREPHHRSELILSLFREMYAAQTPRRLKVSEVIPQPFYDRVQSSVSRALKTLADKRLLRKSTDISTNVPFLKHRRISYALTPEGRRLGRRLDSDQAWRVRRAR